MLTYLLVPCKHELAIRQVQFSAKLKKEGLLERLREALKTEVKVRIFGDVIRKSEKKKDKRKNDDLSEFAPGSYWEPLNPKEEAVEEPENTIRNARAPTVPADEAGSVPVKHNFAETFDRPIFTGKRTVPKYHSNGKRIMQEGRQVNESVMREHLSLRQEFLRKNKLTQYSDPVEYANAFLPWDENLHDPKWLSISKLTTFTNMKAQLSNAGDGGTCYRDFKPFNVKEIRQFLGLYVLNGLSPSPRIEMKFQPQHMDRVQGSDYVQQNLPPNATRRFRHFKAFFACQDPRKMPPARKVSPLFKVSPVVKWMNFIGHNAVLIGMNAAVDEQTIGFQGRHVDKLRITYKAEGDGFQCDVLCEEGFTYAVYFRNEPPPAKYIRQGFSPLHARVLWLFDQLRDNYHRVWMDNLYLSAKFVKGCYNHERKVLIAGVTRKQGRGIPLSVLQEEVMRKSEQEQVRGTVKVSVLKGDPHCPDLVAASVYDTKPVHFLSMIAPSIQWVKKERQVYNVDSGRVEKMGFLRLNINDDYNNDMGHVDVSDQLRNSYRFDHWLQQWKWWWSIWNWAFGVFLVNAFVVYNQVMEEANVPKKHRLTHYAFREKIALQWIKSDEVSIRQRQRDSEQRQEERSGAVKARLGGDRSEATRKRATMTNPNDNNQRKRRKVTPPHKTRGQMEMVDTKGKAHTLTDSTIASPSGPLAKRCDRFLRHFPVRSNNTRPKCAVHRWAADMEEKKDVYRCCVCEIHLCIDCFPVFHCKTNLLEHKQTLRDQLLAKKEDKKASKQQSKPSSKSS
ncbi:unknown protein [Seminavis robusta]|uniref:PiggyBac transposable element-derived protein domain-containing protein n=1 Tax=Seminavis robusta TaxID=568900 RepID=A0A9N8EDR4_9STRA|nr:unknown protein [Seminavis robusta]|eukprot:Sro1027_g233070.1 n/a (788) ;mRNA; f:20808-23171